jgi:hypothetical protein
LFSRIDETASAAWLCPALMNTARDAPEQPWVLDIDASTRPLSGQQKGTESALAHGLAAEAAGRDCAPAHSRRAGAQALVFPNGTGIIHMAVLSILDLAMSMACQLSA